MATSSSPTISDGWAKPWRREALSLTHTKRPAASLTTTRTLPS